MDLDVLNDLPKTKDCRQTKTIQECIEEPSKMHLLKEDIEKGRELYKMQTFDQHLTDLYRLGTVTLETAKTAATSASGFERKETPTPSPQQSNV